MAGFTDYYQARDIIDEILLKDLVGPVDRDEVVAELPLNYYIMGKLYPQTDDIYAITDQKPGDCEKSELVLDSEINEYDESISLSNVRNPSAMGITCAVKNGIDKINILVSYAFYLPIPFQTAASLGIDVSKWSSSKKPPKELWQRQQYNFDKEVTLSEQEITTIELEQNICLKIYRHKNYVSDDQIITFTVVNNNCSTADSGTLASKCAFQVELKLFGDGNIFNDVSQHLHVVDNDDEILEMDMLYADVVCYAQGHGCSVSWEKNEDGNLVVGNSWLVQYNLLQMMPGILQDEKSLSMNFLAHDSTKKILLELKKFATKYTQWIQLQKDKISNINTRYKRVAKKNIANCEAASSAINKAIELLKTNANAMCAFKYANEAMLMQRIQTLKKDKKAVDVEHITWYPFQLAFILHELPSFIDPSDESREKVDLLWFPTGGGKTEAYLGITAFVIFLRRLRNSQDDGVTVIMRYTLRLLTIQQFERASILVCACELLRKKYKLDGNRITIGLWVGGQLTPNSLSDARSALVNLQEGNDIGGMANPCQMKICPWCGCELTSAEYCVDSSTSDMRIKCSNAECEFCTSENTLPLNLIDETIYNNPPTFLIATIDKFAQLPLMDKPAALFGISNGKNPPELIIQDELHLISGPLGTITGLYEAIITNLCKKNGIGAKIIASTATIRNAAKQIRALYGKDFTQFPPQGLSAKDSFFAIESTSDKRPSRQYLGVLGIGTTATTTLIRVNAALLFATRYLVTKGFDDKVIDSFWTITGYFNSLRELGGASIHILDSVQSRFKFLAENKLQAYFLPTDMIKEYTYIEELTSRLDNKKITTIIQDTLKHNYVRGYNSSYVLDFILASNMISVGVDVGRLGSMVVVGQPKTNAEYIQASSRVGRENPGLVVTVYNSTRSRDRSHYEQFVKYHSAMYRYVEATSLTPFADRARDRALHALYVALYRYLVYGKLDNKKASEFEIQGALKIENIITDYVQQVDVSELEAVKEDLIEIRDAWINYCDCERLVYKKHGKEEGESLLQPDTDIGRFATMNSMRNVDSQTGIFLLGED